MLSPINVLMLSQYRDGGGAARAAWRIFEALRAVESETQVFPYFHSIRGETESDRVTGGFPNTSFSWRLWFWTRVFIHRIWSRFLFRPSEKGLYSSPRVDSQVEQRVGNGEWNVINLHWLGDATVSVREIGSWKTQVVWTLHDMWPYCGAEHVTQTTRFREGYSSTNRARREKGPDINLETWQQKLRYWTNTQSVVAPSEWAATSARGSSIFGDRDTTVIPHPINTEFWSPGSKAPSSKNDLGRSSREIRIGLVAHNHWEDWVKGLGRISRIFQELESQAQANHFSWALTIVGGHSIELDIKVERIERRGQLTHDHEMRAFYREIDMLLVPSEMDTFGLVAQEAQSCGTPVVCFGNTGVESVVADRETGYVAARGDDTDFARGILWVAASASRRESLSRNSRLRAETIWNIRSVGLRYADYFRQVASAHQESEAVDR